MIQEVSEKLIFANFDNSYLEHKESDASKTTSICSSLEYCHVLKFGRAGAPTPRDMTW